MKLFSILFFFLSLSVQAALPKPVLQRLSNGLTLAVFEDRKLPLIDYVLLLPTGSLHDPVRKSGTAQLLVEMLDRGSAGLSASAFAEEIEKRGASLYSSLDQDSITLGVHGLSEDQDVLWELFMKWVQRPNLDTAEFKTEKNQLLERWNHLDDQTALLTMLGFQRRISSQTSYARGTVWSKDELIQVNLSDVMAFHANGFKPSGAILAIVGKVQPAEWLKKWVPVLEKWQGKPAPIKLSKFANPKYEAGSDWIVAIDKPAAAQADIKLGVRSSGLLAPDFFDLLVSNSLFGDTFNSKLNMQIRDEGGFVYSIGSAFSHSIDFSTWSVATSTRPEVSGQVLKKIHSLYSDFQKGNFTAEEVNAAKSYLIGSFPLSTSTLGQMASRWLAGQLFKLPADHLERFIDRVKAVKWESAKKAVQKNFKDKKLMTVISCDRMKCEKSLVEMGFKKLKWLKASDLK